MLNQVTLIGRLANDPELKLTPSGVSVSRFRVAVNRPYTNQQGEREADFIDVVAWRQPADFAGNYLNRGCLVAVVGRLQIRSYEDQQGIRRRSAEVVCETLKMLARPRDPGEGGGGGNYGSQAPAYSGGNTGSADDSTPYDDPFQDE
ncbi:MAG: single-stranded DNA-binding protein [Armatimonadetes bacterium]|nr:single-stranded DNA-binding protein [Armatimonadota bacterium]